MRGAFSTPSLSLLLVGFALLLDGCRSREDVPYLGRWEGGFTVHRITGKTQVPIVRRNDWKGYLILYRTQDGELGNRCQSHLENEQEGVDLKGHWKVHRRQIELRFDEIKIDDAGGIDARDPNKAYLDATEIQKTFQTPMILTLSGREKVLQGSLVEFGPLEGEFHFQKTALAH